MENKVCKNKKCMKPLPEGYKHKYCEACRNQHAQKVKNGLKAAAGLAGTAACFGCSKTGSMLCSYYCYRRENKSKKIR